MNLVIDCFKLVKGAGKSIGIYNLAKSITEHLGQKIADNPNQAKAKEEDSIIILGNSSNRAEFDVPGVTFVEVKGNPLNKIYCILWELFIVTRYARKYSADRILFPRGFRPLRCFAGKNFKDTIIIHDLIPFFYDEHFPGVFNKTENAYIMNRLKASIKGADRVITISKCSKDDILKRIPGCGDKITVINNGVNTVTYPVTNTDSTNEKEKDYIVAMTTTLPHKNAGGILKAYETYYKMADKPLELAVIGIADTSFYAEMDREAAAHVTCYKFFEKFDDVCRKTAGGKAYLFLSFMEGFGFPPLEAMQMGVPVVCSDRSSLPEVVQDAGILVDPDDINKVAKALIQITTDEEKRAELIAKGYENVKRFSWESRTDLYWKELFQK